MPVPEKWVLAEPWVIRDKTTGRFIWGKSVNLEPLGCAHAIPRMFINEGSAKGFLNQWCRGTMFRDDWAVRVKPAPHRIKANMEIIQLQLIRVP